MDRWSCQSCAKKNQILTAPQFKMRIDPALKEQLDAVAAEEGVSLPAG
jgi:predicted HicB family RNase H-like nuclease